MKVLVSSEKLGQFAKVLNKEAEILFLQKPLCLHAVPRLVAELEEQGLVSGDVVLLKELLEESAEKRLEAAVQEAIGGKIFFRSVAPQSLDQLFFSMERTGEALGTLAYAKGITSRWQAQLKDWAQHFYPRIRQKKMFFLTSIDPILGPSRFIADIIRACGGVPVGEELKGPEKLRQETLTALKPDVLLVALEGKTLEENIASSFSLEKLSGWESIPAVKRGEVLFADGQELFFTPGVRFLDAAGIIVSGLAGLESGYITERDSYRKLRWVELHRHRSPK